MPPSKSGKAGTPVYCVPASNWPSITSLAELWVRQDLHRPLRLAADRIAKEATAVRHVFCYTQAVAMEEP